MQDPQPQVTLRQESELNIFAKNFFRFLAKKLGPNGEVLSPVKTVRSGLGIIVEKAVCVTYQFTRESVEEVCRKKFPATGDFQINSFADWLYDTIVEYYMYPSIFSSLYSSAIFVHVAVLFAKSRGYTNYSEYPAELWTQAFIRCFGNEFFRKGSYKALEQESEKAARFYDRLMQKYPTGVFDVAEMRQKTVHGLSLFNHLFLEGASKKTESRRAMRRARNSKAKDELIVKKDLRKLTKTLTNIIANKVEQIESLSIMKTPPELIKEGFPPVTLPTEGFYRLLLSNYHEGKISKKEVIRQYENFNREVVVPNELRGMELRELPGAREDPEEVVSPRSELKGAFSKKSLAKVEVPDELRGMELRQLPGAREDSDDSLHQYEVRSPRNKLKGAIPKKSLAKVEIPYELKGMDLRKLPGTREDSDNPLNPEEVRSPRNKTKGATPKKSLKKGKVPYELRGMELRQLPGAREDSDDSLDPQEVRSPSDKTKGAIPKRLAKVEVPYELRGMDLRELPGAREDSEDSLDLDKIPLPRNKNNDAVVGKNLAKPRVGESVSELTADAEKTKVSVKSRTKVEADEGKTESAIDVASNEAKCSDDSEDSDCSGESSQEETKKQRPRKSGGGKKKKGKGKKKKKKRGK